MGSLETGLFDNAGGGALDLPSYRNRLAELASQGVYLGTSSWKYAGWCGLLYDEQRYVTRGKFSEAKFERTCLAEYAQIYSTVCVDAGYYQFPTERYIAGMCDQVPEGFKFAFKITDEITVRKFPTLPRFGVRGGTVNKNFLNAGMFRELFLEPLSGYRSKIGPLIFEFSTFHKQDFEHGRNFVAALDGFLGALPKGPEYGVEMRNKGWLHPDYFAMLRSHGVAHVFNSWTRMPPVSEQLAMEGSDTAPFSVSRLLLKPGRAYEEAVKTFQPYSGIKETQEEVRNGIRKLITDTLVKKRKAYIYVNNRLEGCAPLTIRALMPEAKSSDRTSTPPL